MAGDPSKASLWANADVFVAPLGTAAPSTALTPFDQSVGKWELVGLLDGDAGFNHNRSQDKTDHYAWGQILVRTSRRNFKAEVQFSALEDNDATRKLVWPGSTPTTLKVPEPQPMLMALELREGTQVKRLISAYQVEATADSYVETENDLTAYPITATVFPNSSKELWITQDSGVVAVASIAITGTGPTAIGEIDRMIATATIVGGGTLVVSDVATWGSSNELSATTEGPYVTGVGNGTPNITATYGGVVGTKALSIS